MKKNRPLSEAIEEYLLSYLGTKELEYKVLKTFHTNRSSSVTLFVVLLERPDNSIFILDAISFYDGLPLAGPFSLLSHKDIGILKLINPELINSLLEFVESHMYGELYFILNKGMSYLIICLLIELSIPYEPEGSPIDTQLHFYQVTKANYYISQRFPLPKKEALASLYEMKDYVN